MSKKFKVEMEVDKRSLKNLDKDIDKLFTSFGRELASAPKMQPMVDKVRQGMTENAMKFQNHPIWEANKQKAKEAELIEFDSPLMVTGQLVQDFIFYAGKPKISQIPYSDEFVLGMFTWAAKERKRPTAKYLLEETRRKKGLPSKEVDEPFTYIQTSELVKMIMRSPRYPIMDSILNLYDADVYRHCERLIDKAFSKYK